MICWIRAGFDKPSEVQQKSIAPFCEGLDVIIEAPPASGKTVSISVGVLNSLDFRAQQCQALILAPTRGLALKVGRSISTLGDYLQVFS